MITMIACMDRDRLIGRGNDLPWKLPEDMSYFKERTMGKTVLMGRKTFESFGGRPLKNRRNVILTRDAGFKPEGAETVHSLEAALRLETEGEELMVIGGEQIYELLLPHADCLLLTEIDASFGGGDAFFPSFREEEWKLADSYPGKGDEKLGVAYRFNRYERVKD
ncbi:dihydrofolate reductase [Paenibacillus sp. D51F]